LTTDPGLHEAAALLGNFDRFWEPEPDLDERRKHLATLYDRVWQDAGTIVAVRPDPAFMPYSRPEKPTPAQGRGDKGGSDGTRSPPEMKPSERPAASLVQALIGKSA
jgi:hypothetical protein